MEMKDEEWGKEQEGREGKDEEWRYGGRSRSGGRADDEENGVPGSWPRVKSTERRKSHKRKEVEWVRGRWCRRRWG